MSPQGAPLSAQEGHEDKGARRHNSEKNSIKDQTKMGSRGCALGQADVHGAGEKESFLTREGGSGRELYGSFIIGTWDEGTQFAA